MKNKAGAIIMTLILTCIVFVGTASDKSPPIEKAKIHVEQFDQAMSAFAVDIMVNSCAIVAAPGYAAGTVLVTSDVARSNEQPHPNLKADALSKQSLKDNRMRLSRWQRFNGEETLTILNKHFFLRE